MPIAHNRVKSWTVNTTVCATLVMATLFCTSSLEAGPRNVRMVEGHTRGFFVLRVMRGQTLPHGKTAPRGSGALLHGHLTLNVAGGFLLDGQVTFSQEKVFRLEAFRHVQRGPSFPTGEVSFDRRSGRFQARIQEKKGDEVKEASGPFDMPADLYNGMTLVLLKNSASGAGVSGRVAIFTPKPRLIKMGADPRRGGHHTDRPDHEDGLALSRQAGDRRADRHARIRGREGSARSTLLADGRGAPAPR